MDIVCPICGQVCEAEGKPAVGQHVLCPFCNSKFTYGESTSTSINMSSGKPIDVKCPGCGTEYEVEACEVGHEAKCEVCGKKFVFERNRLLKDVMSLAITAIIFIVVVAGFSIFGVVVSAERIRKDAIKSHINIAILNIEGTNAILKTKLFKLDLDKKGEIRKVSSKINQYKVDREYADAEDNLNKQRDLYGATCARERDEINLGYMYKKDSREADYNLKIAAAEYVLLATEQEYSNQQISIKEEIRTREKTLETLRWMLQNVEKYPRNKDEEKTGAFPSLKRMLHMAETDPEGFNEGDWKNSWTQR